MDLVRKWIARREISALIMLLALCGIFQAANPVFLSWANMGAMFRALSLPGIMAIGMAICLISGAIDLSVGASAGFAASLSSVLMMRLDYPIWFAILAAIAVSALIGLLNYIAIYRLKIIAFIATIGMMYVLKSVANWITNGTSVYPIPETVVQFGQAQPLGVSWSFWIFLVLLIIAEIVLSQTVWGLEVRATGSNRETARDTEVRIEFVSVSVLILLGALAGLSGVLAMSRVAAGNPTIGTGWEFQAILACALGGVSLFGHDGSLFGMFLGLLLMQTITTGLVEIGVNPYLEGAIMGVLLICALALDVQKRTAMRVEE